MLRLAFIVILIGAVIGALMPSSGGKTAGKDRIHQVGPRTTGGADGDEQVLDGGSVAVMLEREDDGHFYADVRVNGTPVRFLIDTGASGIALSEDDAENAGLVLSSGASEVVGMGASGEVYGEFVELDSVELGSASVNEVPAIVLHGGEQSLLGQSFLSKFGSVEIRGDKMVLR